ncbi:MAG: SIMPL domain-containing protein [Halodesulfurarchaeum sp.]
MDRGSIIALALAVAMVAGAGTAGVAMALADQPASLDQPTTAHPSNRTITVSASAAESAEPDAAIVRLAVVKTAPDPNTARVALAETVSAVTERLTALNLSDDQIRTTDYWIGKEYRPPTSETKGEREQPVYQARQTIEVHLNDTESVGAVIDAAVESGATNVQNVRFTLSAETRSDLRNAALEAAMEQARTQAETLANAAGLTLRSPLAITTESSVSPIVGYAVETARVSSATSIDPGPVSVSAHVTVTYEASKEASN